MLPLLLLLDAAVDNRSSAKESVMNKVGDRVAEDVLKCLEELLGKCQLGSVDQVRSYIAITLGKFMSH